MHLDGERVRMNRMDDDDNESIVMVVYDYLRIRPKGVGR